MKLDNFNLQILDCLKENARMSFAQMGKVIGLTAPAVAQRIHIMEKEGVIQGFTVRINEEHFGIDIKAIITMRYGLGKRATFMKKVKEYKEVQSCYMVTGDDCVVMMVLLRNNKHLVEFLDRISEYGISKTSIVLEDLVSR